MTDCLLGTYSRLPVSIVKGEGSWIYDEKGHKYLDAISGIGVTSLGHTHPGVTSAIVEQAQNLLHVSNLLHIDQQERLAGTLCNLADFKGKVFFNNSGAEAVETAIKLARLYGSSLNKKLGKVVVMERSFHGRTLATLSASGSRKVQAGFEPLVQGFVRTPFNDLEALTNIAKNEPDIVAVLVEPVQGEGGIFPASDDYMRSLRNICDEHKWILMCDEIQCGMGRTGKMFGYQHSGITPDVVILAKALANGVPIGACMISDKYSELFKPGSHGSTFGGNPLSCSAGIAVLNAMESESLWENAALMGDKIKTALTERLSGNEHVVDVRGLGLMLGIELDKPCRDILKLAIKNKIIFNIVQENVVRLLPPINISEKDTDFIIETVPMLIEQFYS